MIGTINKYKNFFKRENEKKRIERDKGGKKGKEEENGNKIPLVFVTWSFLNIYIFN